MGDFEAAGSEHLSTSGVAQATGYSVQQVRILENLGVIPGAHRSANGYRRFDAGHVTALRVYRDLACAVGPTTARVVMRDLAHRPHDEVIADVVALHVDLARARERTIAARRALDSIADEAGRDAVSIPTDSMTITELSTAIGVRASTLRFWEREGLITAERPGGPTAPRRYPPAAVRNARIVEALRAGGYRIPAVRMVMASIATFDTADNARNALDERLATIASQAVALLRAGSRILGLLDPSGENPVTYDRVGATSNSSAVR